MTEDVFAIAGLLLLSAGVYLLAGTALALITAGGLLMVQAWLVALLTRTGNTHAAESTETESQRRT